MLLLLPLVFYLSNAKSERDHNVVDRVIVFISAPVQWLTVRVLDGVSRAWHRYVHLVGVEEENEQLRVENAALRREVERREEDRLENDRLRRMTGLLERDAGTRALFCRVVAREPTPLFRSARIDRGSADGVEVGAAVLNQDGVVGRVAAAADNFSDVMLLVDPASSTDVLVQRTRARARVRGRGGDSEVGVEVEHLGRAEDVEPTDVLITSGTGVVFPRGLVVGRVTAVERGNFGLYQQATVDPAVDFSRLEEVMVLVPGWAPETSFEGDQPHDQGVGDATDSASPAGGPP